MTIQYAILGLLSWQPLSGYDLKKIISGSDVFYWSGNNNQIYKSLIELHDAGLVEQQVQPQENLPAKKIYSITDQGRIELYNWVRSAPELPELHSNFLIQLAWAGQFTIPEIDILLASYAAEIDVQLRMQQEKARRPSTAPNRTPQETFLWEKITEKTALDYQHELDWVRRVRAELKEKAAG
jgi:PadR family transcriptional regulator, regulatory protein AphA